MAAAADFANVAARTPAGYATAAYDSFSPPPLARSESGYATSAYKAFGAAATPPHSAGGPSAATPGSAGSVPPPPAEAAELLAALATACLQTLEQRASLLEHMEGPAKQATLAMAI